MRFFIITAALLSFFSSAAQAQVINSPCTVLGETKISVDKASVLACMLVTGNANVTRCTGSPVPPHNPGIAAPCIWKPMVDQPQQNTGLTYVGSCTTGTSFRANTACKCWLNETIMVLGGYNGWGNWGDSVNCTVYNQNSTSVIGYAYYGSSVQGNCTYLCFR